MEKIKEMNTSAEDCPKNQNPEQSNTVHSNENSSGGGNLIIVPYAELDGAKSGLNISSTIDKRALYLKNCLVALFSIRVHNDDNTDVAFVTNIDVPDDYRRKLENKRIIVIRAPFTSFFPGNDYQWCLAFYKLCALKYVVDNTNYDKYAYLDSDIYCQRSFSDIWEEADQHVMLYDTNHGLSDKNYKRFILECSDYYGFHKLITHYGGEFFASNKKNAIVMINTMKSIFDSMLENGINNKSGDEYVLSLAASENFNLIKNAGAYVYRYWTNDVRLINSLYKRNNMVILHCPGEKSTGILKIYKIIEKKHKLPKNNKIHKYLHLNHRSIRCMMSIIKSKIWN